MAIKDEECLKVGENVLLPPSLKRFAMRGALNNDDPLVVDTQASELEERREYATINAHLLDEAIRHFQEGTHADIAPPLPP